MRCLARALVIRLWRILNCSMKTPIRGGGDDEAKQRSSLQEGVHERRTQLIAGICTQHWWREGRTNIRIKRSASQTLKCIISKWLIRPLIEEHETSDRLVTIINLEIYYREHWRWWCAGVGDITSLTHAATCARLTISRCVLEDNVETRRKTDAVPVYGDQHCCYEDSSPGHSSLSSPSGPSSSAGRSSGSHQGRKGGIGSKDQWVTERHWISINSIIWQQGGVGSQTASASFVKNSHYYQNETFNIYLF